MRTPGPKPDHMRILDPRPFAGNNAIGRMQGCRQIRWLELCGLIRSSKNSTDSIEQSREPRRFKQKDAELLQIGIGRRLAAHEDDSKVGLVLLHLPRERDAVEVAGQCNIDDSEVDRLSLEDGERFDSVRR